MRKTIHSLVIFIAVSFCGKLAALPNLNGEEFTLQDIIGQGEWVMVNVWSPGCSHCVAELPTLIEFHRQNSANAQVLGVAVDYPGFGPAQREPIAQFAGENAINFPILLADGASAKEFIGEPVKLLPITFAYNPKGQLVAVWHGQITMRDLEEILKDFTVGTP